MLQEKFQIVFLGGDGGGCVFFSAPFRFSAFFSQFTMFWWSLGLFLESRTERVSEQGVGLSLSVRPENMENKR